LVKLKIHSWLKGLPLDFETIRFKLNLLPGWYSFRFVTGTLYKPKVTKTKKTKAF